MSSEAIDTLENDEVLVPLVEKHGPLELTPADDIVERLVRAIVRHQDVDGGRRVDRTAAVRPLRRDSHRDTGRRQLRMTHVI